MSPPRACAKAKKKKKNEKNEKKRRQSRVAQDGLTAIDAFTKQRWGGTHAQRIEALGGSA
jgi:hypothetical protein